mgnify:CR=1 FL=1
MGSTPTPTLEHYVHDKNDKHEKGDFIMGRINPDDMDKYGSSNSSEWLKLQNDGDVARVQFLNEGYNDLDTFVCHKVQVGDKERYVDCKRDYDMPLDACPFCAAGFEIKPVLMLSMYDHSDGKVKIWERGKTFKKKIEALCNRYPDFSNTVFEIERRGAKGDKKTTYEIFPMPNIEPVDLSEVEKPEFMGSFILDKTPDEMQTYLDTGAFPETSNQTDEGSVESRRRNTEPLPRRGTTSRASRRVGM